MATRLGDMAVGSTVKIKVDGTLKDFLVVQQGLPSSDYDQSCNGTWLLMKDIVATMPFYSDGDFVVDDYLKTTFPSLLPSGIYSAIKTVTLKYYEREYYNASDKVFLLACRELNYGMWISGLHYLKYFSDSPDENSGTSESWGKRVAYYEGRQAKWWTREFNGHGNSAVVYTDGSISSAWSNDEYGVRPAFILPFNLMVSSNGMVGTIPGITTDATDLGEQNAPFTVAYTATDTGTGKLTVTEKLDGEVKQTRTDVAPGTALTVDWLAEKVGYQQVLNGAHTITLEVDNGIMPATKTITFTKNVTGATVSLTAPLTADDTITVAALTLEGSFSSDMSLSVEMTNNARDDAPVWENCTDIQRGESRAFAHHAFANKTAAKGAAFNYKVTITRGESGVGGNITMIGGVIG